MRAVRRAGSQAPPGCCTRALVHVPILHTKADMGGLGQSVQQATIQKLGRQGWQRSVALIDKRWAEIEEAIDALPFAFERVRLYQDGLPICGREAEIVAELAAAGSRNHRLLLRLRDAGATLMGTESPDLLQEEYRLAQQLLAAATPVAAARIEARQKPLSQALLRRRDQFIAGHINQTLLPGETGILFLGMLHSLAGLLDSDIHCQWI